MLTNAIMRCGPGLVRHAGNNLGCLPIGELVIMVTCNSKEASDKISKSVISNQLTDVIALPGLISCKTSGTWSLLKLLQDAGIPSPSPSRRP